MNLDDTNSIIDVIQRQLASICHNIERTVLLNTMTDSLDVYTLSLLLGQCLH